MEPLNVGEHETGATRLENASLSQVPQLLDHRLTTYPGPNCEVLLRDRGFEYRSTIIGHFTEPLNQFIEPPSDATIDIVDSQFELALRCNPNLSTEFFQHTGIEGRVGTQ